MHGEVSGEGFEHSPSPTLRRPARPAAGLGIHNIHDFCATATRYSLEACRTTPLLDAQPEQPRPHDIDVHMQVNFKFVE